MGRVAEYLVALMIYESSPGVVGGGVDSFCPRGHSLCYVMVSEGINGAFVVLEDIGQTTIVRVISESKPLCGREKSESRGVIL